MPLRIGTRASALARWQAEWVAGALRKSGTEVELVPIRTSGDADQQGPIGAIGTQGVFTSELQRALLAGEIDLAVHSLKDLPTERVKGLVLAAVPARAPADDALVAGSVDSLDALPGGAVIGTGSLRRQAQLFYCRPDLLVYGIRGNVDTRLKKLDDGEFDAVVLAVAGLERLELGRRITQRLPHEIMLPAIGQGALGLETRSDDHATRAALGPLDHPPTRAAVTAERSLLAALEGGCLAPIAAHARPWPEGLHLTARVAHPRGKKRLDAEASGPVDDAEELGRRVAEALLQQGAADLIAAART
ncbi:MAG: hydroxymethylbilane synthase [Pirellulales bacterium]